MAIDWFDVRATPIEAVEAGVEAADEHFRASATGPRDYTRIKYPFVQVMPEATDRADATNWRHRIAVNLIFEYRRDMDYVDDVLVPMADILDHVLAELSDVDCITNYHPASIEDFTGEADNGNLLFGMLIRFEMLTLVDPGAF